MTTTPDTEATQPQAIPAYTLTTHAGTLQIAEGALTITPTAGRGSTAAVPAIRTVVLTTTHLQFLLDDGAPGMPGHRPTSPMGVLWYAAPHQAAVQAFVAQVPCLLPQAVVVDRRPAEEAARVAAQQRRRRRGIVALVLGAMALFGWILSKFDTPPDTDAPTPDTTATAPASPSTAKDGTVRVDAQTGTVAATPPPPVPPKATAFPSPASFAAHSPERALAAYMAAWRQQDWQAMAAQTQLTWQAGEADPAQTLQGMNDFRAVKGFRILGTTHTSDTCADVQYEFWVETNLTGTPVVTHATATARVVREVAARTPSARGTWGVNPIVPSTAR